MNYGCDKIRIIHDSEVHFLLKYPNVTNLYFDLGVQTYTKSETACQETEAVTASTASDFWSDVA
jgi:hypothetical protein